MQFSNQAINSLCATLVILVSYSMPCIASPTTEANSAMSPTLIAARTRKRAHIVDKRANEVRLATGSYEEYRSSLRKRNFRTFKRKVTDEYLANVKKSKYFSTLSQSQAEKRVLQDLARQSPAYVKVVRSSKKGDVIVLTAVQELLDLQPQRRDWRVGRITMVERPGNYRDKWKVHSTQWTKSPPRIASSKIRTWCAKAKDQEFPKKAAQGKIREAKFVVSNSQYYKNLSTLNLNYNNPVPNGPKKIVIRLWKNRGIVPARQNFVVAGAGKFNDPQVEVSYQYRGLKGFKTVKFSAEDGYGMKLFFGKIQGNKLPGYIVLRLPYEKHSSIAGYFMATVR